MLPVNVCLEDYYGSVRERMQHHIRHAVWFRYTFAERLSHRSKSPTSPPHMETVPPKHPQNPHCPRVDFGVLLPLVLLVFYGDFLRILLSILGFPDLKISVFLHLTSQKPQKHWIFWLPPGPLIFHQIPLSSEIPSASKFCR